MVTKERLEEVAQMMKDRAVKFKLNIDREGVSDCESLEEAYYLGRLEQIESFLLELEEGED